ncbi:DUF421 domain-containing protein [Serpentinicella sp. ANB-PHB4]|uniref:DUF421 domain-containing protein n=1 Tax=Serpentinicella sp. ANB-PHB4 TaxID=3074076 RepID=UPI002861355C|nr:DUF421 domain-containing protein [Serpentinicella sp. ANB-PHB4]MDR5658941.1 DUF421 domain-containing protein [Serpentinicella sp. ANB-PHB4]
MRNWIEILLRSVALFFVALVFVKIISKRNVARMTAFNLVNYLVVAIIAGLISVNVIDNVALGMVALSVWVILSFALDYLSLKSKMIHDWINGKEMVLIKDGKIMEENLKQARLTGEELLKELRSKEVFSFMDVEFAIMETTGEINFLLKSENTPITPKQIGKKVSKQTAPQTVILDGNVIDESLSNIGLNQNWLYTQLEGMGVSLDNVYIAQVDSSGDLYVDLFDDALQIPEPTVREMLYANLEKCQADLTSFSLETEDKNAKNMYALNAEKLGKVIDLLEPHLMK